jgi:hypothetical protein
VRPGVWVEGLEAGRDAGVVGCIEGPEAGLVESVEGLEAGARLVEQLEAELAGWVGGRLVDWADAGLEAGLGEERIWSARAAEGGRHDHRAEEGERRLVGEG